MHFNADWYTHQKHFIDPLIESFKPKTLLEIGSFEGLSTVMLMQQMTKYNDDIAIYSLDTWAGSEEHVNKGVDFQSTEELFENNVQEFLNHHYSVSTNKIVLYKYKISSVEGMCTFISNNMTFDLIYIDGAHTAADVFIDAALAFRLCNLGGVLIFDDYEWTGLDHDSPQKFNKYKTPKIAIDAFENCFGNKIVSLHANGGTYQKYYRKVNE